MNTKFLKIGYTHSTNRTSRKTKFTPKITLTGEWLKNLGFEIGQNVEIEIKKNQLIIKNLNQ